MDKSQSLTSPPYFDGNNYAYWKVRMRAFLKSVDERVWVSITKGWRELVVIIEGVQTPKSVDNYSRDEISECGWNNKGLNAIFMAVSQEEFKRISMCENCKEAWDILEVTHEGTNAVKNSKLHMLTTSFEELRMKDDETFDAIYAKLNHVVNSSFNLGDKIPENRIVRKILKSLPERFHPKVTAIEESKDLDNMRIEELVGSLQTYEHTLPVDKKNKSIALNTIDESSDELAMSDKEIAFYAKKFWKMFVSRNRKNWGDKKKMFERVNTNSSSGNKEWSSKKYTRAIKDKCANYKKAIGKAKGASLSDNDSETSDSSKSLSPKKNRNYMAFTSSVGGQSHRSESTYENESISGSESGDDDELEEIYEKLYNECVKLRKLNKTHIQNIDICKRENEDLQGKLNEAICLTDQLQKRNVSLKNKMKMQGSELILLNDKLKNLSTRKQKLDKILNSGKSVGDKRGIGYIEGKPDVASTSKTPCKKVGKIIFVPASNENGKAQLFKKGKKPLHVQKPVPPPKRQGARNTSSICHHCGKVGDVRQDCFKLNNQYFHALAFTKSRTAYTSEKSKKFLNAPRYVSPSMRQKAHKAKHVCHNCGKIGHIRPNCFELRDHPKKIVKPYSRKGHQNLWSQVMVLTKQNEMINVKLDQLTTSQKADTSLIMSTAKVMSRRVHPPQNPPAPAQAHFHNARARELYAQNFSTRSPIVERLRNIVFRVTPGMLADLLNTPRVANPTYPYTRTSPPSPSVIVECRIGHFSSWDG
ncbi:hypothetical protein F2P56_022923 [Juglans regia]|uniref:Uncharacterized protein LOC109010107 n=2 Tax=Juglans regia TaxID=51240 RepID=A0A2I4GR55_JUGRE|nr:uncharacterized protein LOC109010107 [Juglans regia]KAF5458930.1 hypothetical protein F2P56_022923 [Juglans regia]